MKPLQHLTILDLSRVLACPFASMILAELGATVIKVEQPGAGDETRGFEPQLARDSAYYFACNRSKASITVNLRAPEGQSIIRELAQKVDVVVVSGARATLAAKKATRAIPVVMLALGDPVGVGAVQSLGRPEGNVTGVSFISSDLAAKRVQLIKEVVPKANGIAILWDPGNANARSEAAATIAAARSLGMAPQPLALTSDSALSDMLRDLTARKPDVLYVAFEGGLVARNRTLIAEFGVKNRVPVISGWSFMTEAGGLISYAPDIPAMFHRSAYYVHRILQGARPGQLPVEQPRKIELVLNQKTAREIGISFSQSILLRADRVIE